MLTLFHNQQFNKIIDSLQGTSQENKQRLKEQAAEFIDTLFKIAQFDPQEFRYESEVKKQASAADFAF